MSGMKVCLKGLIRNSIQCRKTAMLDEFLEHLKIIRDDPSRHHEFFDLYLFDDDDEYRKKRKEQKNIKLDAANIFFINPKEEV